MTGITFRSLRASDAIVAADVHREAFPGFFLARLGVFFLRAFYRGMASTPGAVSVVLELDNQIVGLAVGSTEPRQFFRSLLMRNVHRFVLAALVTSAAHPSFIPRLLKAIAYRGGVPLDSAEGALLSSICISPSFAGKGLGARLLDEWCRQAAVNGATAAYLTTDAEQNEPANAFYGDAGWSLAGEFAAEEGRRMFCYTKSLT